MSIAKQEFTNAGRSMLGRAQNGETLTISKIVVGSGSATQASDLWPLTALLHQELNVTISSKDDDGNGQLLVEGIFRSDTAPHAFDLHEVGVMAHIGAEADRLYSVANAFTDPVDHIDPAAPTFYGYKIKLIIDRIPAASLVISIGPTDAIQGQNQSTGAVGPGWFKEAIGNVLRFKRVAAGYNTEVVEDVSQDFITIGQKVLHNNVDLYVPASNQDYPGYPAPPPPNTLFADIQAAHDYLLQFTIPSDKFATIHVYKGTFTYASPIQITHPNAQQIGIIGKPRNDRNASSITYVNGTSKTVFVPNTTDLAVGLNVWLAQNTMGNVSVPWVGGCKVNNLPSTTITLSTLKRDTQPNFTTASAGVGRLSFLPTQIVNNTGTVFSLPNGIRYLQNLCIYGSAATGTFGVYSLDDTVLIDCHVMHNVSGINCTNGLLTLQGECVITDCDFGITANAGMRAAYQTIVNACTQGILPTNGALLGGYGPGLSTAALYLVHNGIGLSLQNNMNAGVGNVFYSWNNNGFYIQLMSALQAGANYGCTPQGNGTDIFASGMSYVTYNCQGQALPTCNPTAETLGNQNSLIHVIP